MYLPCTAPSLSHKAAQGVHLGTFLVHHGDVSDGASVTEPAQHAPPETSPWCTHAQAESHPLIGYLGSAKQAVSPLRVPPRLEMSRNRKAQGTGPAPQGAADPGTAPTHPGLGLRDAVLVQLSAEKPGSFVGQVHQHGARHPISSACWFSCRTTPSDPCPHPPTMAAISQSSRALGTPPVGHRDCWAPMRWAPVRPGTHPIGGGWALLS